VEPDVASITGVFVRRAFRAAISLTVVVRRASRYPVCLAVIVLLALPRFATADALPPPAGATDTATLLRGLDTDDPKALADAITAIERAPSSRELADVLFAAGRACEDRLYDPGRALALYERILRENADAGVSIAAGRRASVLRGSREHALEAAQLAELIATADATAPPEVERRATELAAAAWPGAVDAALFLADWLCRTGRFREAQARYAKLLTDAPDANQIHVARRNAAGCASRGAWRLRRRC
jgi:tetratricopeptide (TPR) repeat protein